MQILRIALLTLISLSIQEAAVQKYATGSEADRADHSKPVIVANNTAQPAEEHEYVGYDEAEKFIRQWLELSESDANLDVVMKYYAESVIFYKFSEADKSFIRNDKKKYYAKWPQRKYSLLKFETVYTGESKISRTFQATYHFVISNSKESLEGDAKVELSLSKRRGVLTIGHEKGQVIKKEWKPKVLGELEPAPTTTRELIKWLQSAWQARRNVEEVKAKLAVSVWPSGTPEMWNSADLDGDGSAEWLFTIYDTDRSPNRDGGGEFWVFNARGIAYTYRFRGESAPELNILKDLTGDGLPDAVISAHGCGASTCYREYCIISAHGGRITNSDSFGMVSPGDLELTEDVPPGLKIKGGIATSAGAGSAQREHTDIWAWNGKAMVRKDTIWDKTKWRHHTLYDGILAHEKGDYTTAIESYSRVLNDKTLENYEAWDGRTGDMVSSYDTCRQFAAFRLVLLYLQRSNAAKAAIWRDWMTEHYPAAPITMAANSLADEWSSSKDPSSACLKVAGQLEKEDRPTWPLNDLGNNLRLNVKDVCPAKHGEMSFMNRARNGY